MQEDTETKKWISQIEKTKAGTLSDNPDFINSFFSVLPICKIQEDKKYYKELYDNGVYAEIQNNLMEITIHLNTSANGNNEYAKQTVYPLQSGGTIDYNRLNSFLNRIGCPVSLRITGDLFAYPEYESLIRGLSPKPNFRVEISCLYEDILSKQELLKKLVSLESVTANIIYPPLSLPWLNKEKFDATENIRSTFIVTNEEEYYAVSSLTEVLNPHEYTILPVFDNTSKESASFFEEYVYLDEDSVNEIRKSKRDVFAHQTLNTNFFGKLVILPDEKIYSNLNFPPIGTLDMSVPDLVYNEMSKGKSWFYVRDNKVCNSCIYQWICPPPSNYELAIGKQNLCMVR